MEDSIPPLIPQGLEGYVDTLGTVRLKWMANTDADLLGYRIYRGQTEGEELIPLTDVAVKTNEYLDSVNLYNLNTKVYYAVAALDKRVRRSSAAFVGVYNFCNINIINNLTDKAGGRIRRNHLVQTSEEDTDLSLIILLKTFPWHNLHC
jgi:hypothetical protein